MSYTLTQSDIDEFETNHSKLYVDDVLAEKGTEIKGNPTRPTERSELKAVTDSGYEFTSTSGFPSYVNVYYYLNGNDSFSSKYFFELNSTDTKATLTTSIDDGDKPTFYVDTKINADYQITQADLDRLENNHATMEIEGEPVYKDMPVIDGDEVIAYADDGFKFDQFQYFAQGGIPTSYQLDENGTKATVTYNKNMEKLIYHISASQLLPDVMGINNVHKISVDDLKEINKQRFVKDPQTEQVYDFGQYILGLIRLPFSIPEDYLADETYIDLGNLDTTVKTPELSSDTLNIDMGEIETPAPYGDLRDFTNTICNLHLPYANSITVENEYVIGQTLRVEYLVSMYDGLTTINLYSTKSGDKPFHTETANLGVNVPYSGMDGQSLYVDNVNVKLGGDNQITKPFIEVLRNESPLTDKYFTIPITDEGELSNASDYIEVDNVKLDIKSLGNEQRQLETLLKNGVHIKEW